MNTHRFSIGIISALLAASLVTSARADPSPPGRAAPEAAIGTSFTYRGQLKSGGAPINGTCDIAFRLFDAGSGGAQVGGALTQTLIVTASLFTAALDFGPGAFAGDARWLDLAVRCPAGAGAFTALSPRQEVTAVPNALFASNADLLDGRDSSAFVDVASTQNIAGVKTFAGGVKFPDGTQLNTAPYRPILSGPGALTIADSLGNVGGHTSLAIGADGLGVIGYQDYGNSDLKILHCGNQACNAGNSARVIDGSAPQVGISPSIAIASDGQGIVSYFDVANGNLKVLHCGNALCNSGNTATTVDDIGDVGANSSIAIGADGLAMISYHDATKGNLKALHCGNTACNSGNISTTLDMLNHDVVFDNAGFYTSIALGADGLMLISYYAQAAGDLRVFHCSNVTCAAYTRVGR